MQLEMRCRENPVESAPDGGIIILQSTPREDADPLIMANLVLSFRDNDAMRAFPHTRDAMQDRVYRVTIEDITP
jgi:hypothetical protein